MQRLHLHVYRCRNSDVVLFSTFVNEDIRRLRFWGDKSETDSWSDCSNGSSTQFCHVGPRSPLNSLAACLIFSPRTGASTKSCWLQHFWLWRTCLCLSSTICRKERIHLLYNFASLRNINLLRRNGMWCNINCFETRWFISSKLVGFGTFRKSVYFFTHFGKAGPSIIGALCFHGLVKLVFGGSCNSRKELIFFVGTQVLKIVRNKWCIGGTTKVRCCNMQNSRRMVTWRPRWPGIGRSRRIEKLVIRAIAAALPMI